MEGNPRGWLQNVQYSGGFGFSLVRRTPRCLFSRPNALVRTSACASPLRLRVLFPRPRARTPMRGAVGAPPSDPGLASKLSPLGTADFSAEHTTAAGVLGG